MSNVEFLYFFIDYNDTQSVTISELYLHWIPVPVENHCYSSNGYQHSLTPVHYFRLYSICNKHYEVAVYFGKYFVNFGSIW